MLTIRLARVGKNKRAQFKIVLQEHKVAPGGRHIEILGSYDPHLKKVTLKKEKIKEWLAKGAKTSATVHNLLVSKGVISGEKIKVKLPKKETAETQIKEVKPEEKEIKGEKDKEGKKDKPIQEVDNKE